MGLTYKEDVPDTRESPARGIVEELKEFGVEVYGYDPLLGREEIEGFGVRAFEDGDMDGVIVAVAHEEFRIMGVEDVRGMFDAREAEEEAVGQYYSVVNLIALRSSSVSSTTRIW